MHHVGSAVSARARAWQLMVVSAVLVLSAGLVGCLPMQKTAPQAKVQVGALYTDPVGTWYHQSVTSELFGSPAVGDLGNGRQSVVAGYPDGNVYVWDVATGARTLKYWTGSGSVQSSPTLVDLNGDGQKDILTANTGGDVVGFDHAGKRLFWAHSGIDRVHKGGNFATPVAADLNKDGKLEIIETSWDHHLYVWTLAGKAMPGFPIFLQDTSWSTPAIGDLNGDGYPDIVFGYDCDGVPGQDCYTNFRARGGYVTAIDRLGRRLQGWPRFVRDQVIWSSPALADLNGDGRLDVVVGTGNMPMPGGKQVLAFNGNGTPLAGWPSPTLGIVMASPAVGDMTGDGRPEVAIVASDGALYIIGRDGKWLVRQCIGNSIAKCGSNLHTSVSMADVDGDGRQEAIVGAEQHVWVVRGNGTIAYSGLIWEGPGNSYYPFNGAPTVAKVNGRVRAFLMGGRPGYGGHVRVGAVYSWDLGPDLGGSLGWQTFHKNMGRTGR